MGVVVIASFELAGTLKCHLVQLPCSAQGHLQLHQVAQSPIQPDLDRLQGWGTATSLGNLCHCFTALIIKNKQTKNLLFFAELLPYIQS